MPNDTSTQRGWFRFTSGSTTGPSNSIEDYRNAHKGRTAFILGTGPSISDLDLTPLQNELVFTVNGATLLAEKFNFTPSFFCTSDARFLQSEKRELATTRLSKKTVRLVRDVIRPNDDPSMESQTIYVETIGKNGFSERVDKGFYFWCTSISLPIQMAWYVGAQRVVLLGVDLNYASDQPRFYPEDDPQPVDPFVGVQIRNIVDAARHFENAGREFYISSERSMLRPYIDHQPFESLVSRPAVAHA